MEFCCRWSRRGALEHAAEERKWPFHPVGQESDGIVQRPGSNEAPLRPAANAKRGAQCANRDTPM